MANIHPAAAQGFASQAAAYASGRPDYSPEVEDWLRGDLGLEPGKRALDLGAGTGKFLPRLLATGADVVAVEPVAEMRAQLSALNPCVDARAGSAQAIPLPDGAVDAVVCAQSFHWFATPDAVAEIRRVLTPGGVLGLIWNVRDATVPWVATLMDVMAPYEGDTPRYQSGAWRVLFPGNGFGPLSERRFSHVHTGSPARIIVDRILSVSFIAALPPAERDRVAARLWELIAATPELAGKSEVTFPYVTFAYSCRKAA